MADYGKALQIITEVKKAVIGKDECIAKSVAAILAGGHILLNDIPGVGKTTLALALAKAMSLSQNRVQFTPDVLPSDIVGFSVYQKETGSFVYQEGSVLCNLFLADEINRTSPKTQSALLEVMEERQVTVDGVTRKMPEPFIVIATQNPFGSAGTQLLPESQLDRFMISMSLGYPSMEDELAILKGEHKQQDVKPVVTARELLQLQKQAEEVYVHEEIYAYIGKLVERTRNHAYIELGVSPRGTICLAKMAKALAFLRQRDFVVPEDVIDMTVPVMGHRIMLNGKARMNQVNEQQLIEQIVKEEKTAFLKEDLTMVKRIAYFIFVLFVAYAAVIYNSASMIFLAGVGIFLPLLLFIILMIQSFLLELTFSETEHFAEEKAGVRLTVSNRSRLPIRQLSVRLEYRNLTTGERKKQWIREAVDTGKTELEIPEMKLGYGVWCIRGSRIRVFDFLCLSCVRKRKRISCELVRLPESYETNIKTALPDTEALWESQEYDQNKSGGDTSYTREIREYRLGDKLQNIHWKLSAKKEQLLVKEYGLPCGCSLLLGISVDGLTKTGIELIYSLMTACAGQHCNFLLVWRVGRENEERKRFGRHSDGETQIRQLPVMKEEDVYSAMEEIMRYQVSGWGQEQKPELPGKQLWLEEPVRLMFNGTVVQEFADEDLKEKLTDMELIV